MTTFAIELDLRALAVAASDHRVMIQAPEGDQWQVVIRNGDGNIVGVGRTIEHAAIEARRMARVVLYKDPVRRPAEVLRFGAFGVEVDDAGRDINRGTERERETGTAYGDVRGKDARAGECADDTDPPRSD